MLRKAFTLLEVNLAIAVMAGGILSLVSLYLLAFREGRQSDEDVMSAAYADAVMSPLVMAITATNMKWSAFREIKGFPAGAETRGWGCYIDEGNFQVRKNCDQTAISAFGEAMSAFSRAVEGELLVDTRYPEAARGQLGTSGARMNAGLLVGKLNGDKDCDVMYVAFRAVRTPALLLSTPIYYTEAKFQGLADK